MFTKESESPRLASKSEKQARGDRFSSFFRLLFLFLFFFFFSFVCESVGIEGMCGRVSVRRRAGHTDCHTRTLEGKSIPKWRGICYISLRSWKSPPPVPHRCLSTLSAFVYRRTLGKFGENLPCPSHRSLLGYLSALVAVNKRWARFKCLGEFVFSMLNCTT